MLIMSVAFLAGLTACGQQNENVPANVKSAFSKKFTSVSKVKWSQENAKEWEAEFKMDGKNYSANFDNSGNWKETEYEISKKEIPSVVQATLNKEFPGFKTEESEISVTKDGKVFEFMLEKGDSNMEVAIDPSGSVLKKEQINEDEENEGGDED